MNLHTRLSFLILAFLLALTRSATSHPLRTSKWVRTAEFPDPISRGTGKILENESFDQLPDPPHVAYDQNPAWQSNQDNEATEQETPSNRFIKGTSESGKPTVSMLIPTSSETSPEHNPHDQHFTDEQEHHSLKSKEKSINALNEVAAQRQAHYSKILQYLYAKHAQNTKHNHETSSSTSIAPSSGDAIALFAFRFSLPVMGSKTMRFPPYQLPGIFTTVTIILAMIWIAMFTIGLVELGNYIWKRRSSTLGQHGIEAEWSMGCDETEKAPLGMIVDASSERIRSQPVGEHGYTFLDSDSEAESDEDDYRIF